jgi:hypothetical protein
MIFPTHLEFRVDLIIPDKDIEIRRQEMVDIKQLETLLRFIVFQVPVCLLLFKVVSEVEECPVPFILSVLELFV